MPKKTKPRPHRSLRQVAETEGVALERLLEAIERGELKAYKFGARDVAVYDEDWRAFKESRAIRPDEKRA